MLNLCIGGGVLGNDKELPPLPVFYPEPPETPRIQFLASFTSESDLRKTEKKKKGGFRSFVLGNEGEEKGPEALNRPYGIEIHDGKIFACDIKAASILIFDLKSREVSRLGSVSPGRLKKPINIFIDTDGTRYVADAVHRRIMVYDENDRYVRAYGDPELMKPVDVKVFQERLYVCDIENAQIVIIDLETGEELLRVGKKGAREGDLYFPSNLSLDPDGNIYVGDTQNFRISKFNARGQFVRSFGSVGDAYGQFARPKGVAVDREGRIFAVDSAFENVQIFDQEGQLLLYFGGPGNDRGNLVLPAAVTIDYENVDMFKDKVAEGQEIEYLILVTSQFGLKLVNVYGFLKDPTS